MSIYLNSFLMLIVTVAAFVLLARLFQAIRSRRLFPAFGITAPGAAAPRLAVEESCAVDGKRRLLLVRCDEQRVLLLTGGPADLVVSLFPALPAADAGR
jgi:flagellar protein FliO/FliZ